MYLSVHRMWITCLVAVGAVAFACPLLAADLQVVQLSPARHTAAPAATAITIDFDKPVDLASVHPGTFRVFGRSSGTHPGAFTFSNSDQSVTFTPTRGFSAGELVHINLSHDLMAADSTFLRAAGFAYNFKIIAAPASAVFTLIDQMSNRTNNEDTRIYGAAAADLNDDGFLDLATINEVSADVRVFLNRADQTGLYHPFLAPQPIGNESSPNETADFNNDGWTDLCIAASSDHLVSILLGAGDGTFASTQYITVGTEPHGIAAVDVDGDGDRDILVANAQSNEMALMINDGLGVFGAATFFEGGVNGERGLASADMNHDGITDVIVGGNIGEEVRVLLNNGDGTFTPGPVQDAGGGTWGTAVDDVNGDGNMDISVANGFSHSESMLLGDGLGGLGAPTTIPTGTHTPSTDLGDIDGDGDADLVLSVFSSGIWCLLVNDGAGNFTLSQTFPAPNNPSCAALYDFDNDGDLDMALTDEIADMVVLMRNGTPTAVEAPSRPSRLTLLANAPNPLRAATALRFELAAASDARLEVFDISGRCVAQRDLLGSAAGRNEFIFDGHDASGKPLRNGVYLYRVTAGDEACSGRMVVAR